jgi:hypothetical protein
MFWMACKKTPYDVLYIKIDDESDFYPMGSLVFGAMHLGTPRPIFQLWRGGI